MEDRPLQFNIENSSIKKAYELLGAKTPVELNTLYGVEDQKLMKSNKWDYKNPDLITNQVKDVLEFVDENSLTEEEKEWRQMILWYWYHHAMSIAHVKFGEKEKAKEFGKRAMELNPKDNSNKITELYYLLLNDDFEKAEALANSVPEGILDDGNPNPEPETARQLINEYKSGNF